MPSCLLTGGGGFLGQYVAKALVRCNWRVHALFKSTPPPQSDNIIPVQGDIRRPTQWIKEIPASLSACIHFAAQLPHPHVTTAQYDAINAEGCRTIVEIARKHKVKTLIYASSAFLWDTPPRYGITESATPNTTSPYHISKLQGEKAILSFPQNAEQRALALRIASPYGVGMPSGTVIGKFLEDIGQGKKIRIFGTGKRQQNFIEARDVAKAVLAALEFGNGIYNIAYKSSINMVQLATILLKSLDMPPDTFTLCPEYEEGPSWHFDVSKAERELHFLAQIAPEKGLHDYVKVYVQNVDIQPGLKKVL